jgi:uncharacterized membrane protein (UPF0127 family)
MRFPIDVVYLNEDKTVVHLEQDLKPWRLAAVRMQAASVIELPCNILHTTGTSIGDEIEIVLGREANTE